MEKLKNRLDAFSDAIIAIIITIMVLNIPPVLHDSLHNYLQLGKSVSIYFISFIFIANMWYQHGTAFSEITTMTYRIVILDMLFLMPLSLMPLLTNMMASNTTTITVVLYGALQLVVNLLFRFLTKAIVHLQYTEATEMRQVYQKIYGNTNRVMDALSLATLVVAFVQPEFSLFVFLAYPIVMFLLNSSARQEMYDVAALPTEQQHDFTQLSGNDLRDFRKAQREFLRNAQEAITNGQPPTDKDATNTSAASGVAEKATKPQAPGVPPSISSWLDQNVDPTRQRQIYARFANMTPEQRAAMEARVAQRMQRWFDQRHVNRNHHHTPQQR
ncbi:TMEM175 family protein [Lacticaseibacillus thailandensis]|uniref:Integral membrane protein n=1 Tax=Lacticaseibacillus thailandensis DSM 22698 = JCM 13996 TaxID=1423810 RepID=A0A0R2C904_9LACO|nr:TMEM175 family protein [Lacticaseibacillus thailandensis]KRM87554.1 hypothetical protein FD19_GL001065 [Lacticaseibacillus thailandensis DSM 22698 = JCM 13996]